VLSTAFVARPFLDCVALTFNNSEGINMTIRNLGIKALVAVALTSVTFGAFAAPYHHHRRYHHRVVVHHPVVHHPAIIIRR
jgi:hypothetical protein